MIQKSISALSVLLLSAFLFAMPALATDDGYTNPVDPVDPVETTPAPTLEPLGYTIDVAGAVSFAGIGTGSFEGGPGQIDINKIGAGVVELTFTAEGDTCGFDCQQSQFNFMSQAFEAVEVIGTVTGTDASKPVVLQNAGIAQVASQFMLQRGPTAPASSSDSNE